MLAVETDDGNVLSWYEFRQSLSTAGENESKFKRFVIKSHANNAKRDSGRARAISDAQYHALLSPSLRSQRQQSSISDLRSEWKQLRAEFSWLLASLLSAVAVAAAVFVGSRGTWALEWSAAAACIAGFCVFAVELLLYIIITAKEERA